MRSESRSRTAAMASCACVWRHTPGAAKGRTFDIHMNRSHPTLHTLSTPPDTRDRFILLDCLGLLHIHAPLSRVHVAFPKRKTNNTSERGAHTGWASFMNAGFP